MLFFARFSIGQKLLCGIMLTSVTALVVATAGLLYQGYHTLQENMQRDLGVLTSMIAENLNAALYFQDQSAATETLSTLKANPHIRCGWLFSVNGTLFASYSAGDHEVPASVASLGITVPSSGLLRGRGYMAKYVPVMVDGEAVGLLYVESDLRQFNALASGYVRFAIWVLLGAVLVAFLLSTLFHRIIARPVLSLVQTTKRISRHKDYSLRAKRFSSDELGQLATTFNEMLDEVQRRDAHLANYNRELERTVAERTKELIAAKEEAEMVSQLKSDFLSTVSHELRTPLTSVRGYAKLVHKQLQKHVFPYVSQGTPKVEKSILKVDENLRVILSEGERLTYLINDVLDLSKLDAGVVEWQKEQSVVGDVLIHAHQVCTGLIDSKGLRCLLEYEDDLPLVYIDRHRIIQVLINLISNAVKFTKEGHVRIAARREGDTIKICVDDTGVGISPKDRERVFERFRQLGDTLTDRPSGTGLGLAISREIIEAHGGRIWVEDTPEGGSAFQFTLPLEEA